MANEDMDMDYDDEEYDFQYDTDDQQDQEMEVDVENQYYNSKGEVEAAPEQALKGFQEVIRMESERGKWGFKALKQICKALFVLGREEDMLQQYKVLLEYVQSGAVTRNDSEKVINKLLDFVSNSSRISFLEQFYETTLEVLAGLRNDRLWFSTTIKLCKICFEAGDYAKMKRILKTLHQACAGAEGQEDAKKGTHLQEICALEIQLCTEQKNHKKLKELYARSMQIKSAIPHPRIMGVIRECGGKMHMSEREWGKAHTDFFEAFKNYDEAGHPRRIQCLKYLVLANMLAVSKINPFDSPEAKPYKDNPDIVAMTDLLNSYEQNKIKDFERILQQNRSSIMDDNFIRLYIEDLLRTIRTQVLIALIKPYTRITIQYISEELNIPMDDVESLLVQLILDNRVDGYIDQMNQVLNLKSVVKQDARYNAISKWSTQVQHLQVAIANKIS
eukprot:GGOE01036736.1.p1 GENE.GGOE01036736.1~~GGOE01036736.1.p1  ORF type:complete len:473 (+),score=198.08 GGOE01036736.1:83-1420(+)